MNILLAFKAEPDAGMLAEKEWQAAAQGKSGPDISLLRSLLGADEQAAAALLAVGAEKKRYADVFNRVEHGG